MNAQLKKSFQDVIPSHQGSLPTEVINCADSLYNLSMQSKPNLPRGADIARYHICAYLAAEKYLDLLNILQPVSTTIPVAPKILFKLLDDFRENLLYQIRSATSSPQTTPRKPKVNLRGSNQKVSNQKGSPITSPFNPASESPFNPVSNPSASPFNPSGSGDTSNGTKLTASPTKPRVSSPLKRLQQLQDEETTPKKRKSVGGVRDVDSPFNPKKILDSPKSPTVYKYDRKHVSIGDFISFANNFYIPSTITPRMVETFLVHRHKFVKKSEWLLACGMIHAAYIRINNKLLKTKMGAKAEFNDQLFHYQKGGLMKWNMVLWCDIVDDWIKDEPWVLEIEKKYVYQSQSLEELQVQQEKEARIGAGWELIEQFGTMIHGEYMFESDTQCKYNKTWIDNALLQLKEPIDK